MPCHGRLRTLSVLCGALLWLGSLLAPAIAEPPAVQRYALQATLNPPRHEVSGHAQITFTNASREPLRKLVFHLYLNAFRNSRSVFMRESGGSMRGQSFTGSGGITLSSLRVDGSDALNDARRELVRGDTTQLEVSLEPALAPGASVNIESDFIAKLPPVFARSGYAGDFFCVAQWFPKLAKLEPDGTFASFPYHALGEFYADFADYELELRTPQDFVVVASGKQIREERDKDEVVRSFVMDRAHDAVWVASPSLRLQRETVAGVEVTYAYAPGYDAALREHADTVRSAIAHFGRRFGTYPYPTLGVVIPPRAAAGAAGMEYSGFFLTDGWWLPTPQSPGISGAFVTAHELAHQWFAGILASDEVRWPVLDEGFAEWAALDWLRTRFGEVGALSAFLPFSRFELERVGTLAGGRWTAPPGRAAYAYTAAEYGTNVYGRAALVLETLRRVYGKARFDAAMRAYAESQRFAHPTPEILESAFDAQFGPGFSARVLAPLLFEGKASNVRIVEAAMRPDGELFRTEVRARRTGEVALPTWLALFDATGKELKRVPWAADSETLHAEFETRTEVARIALDPDRSLLVDDDTRDQVRVLEAPDRSPWLSRLIALSQALLSWVGP